MRYTIIADSINKRDFPVLYRQGDLDGACALYCLMMCLNLCGYSDNETSFAEEPDRRSLMGKLYKKFENSPFLLGGGCFIADFKNIIADTYGKYLSTEYIEGNNKIVLSFAVRHLLIGHPIILGIKAQGAQYGHAITASGLEFELCENYDLRHIHEKQPHKILTLDPGGYDMPSFIHWNGFIYYEPVYKGRFPYLYVDAHCDYNKVSFDCALAVWKTKKN